MQSKKHMESQFICKITDMMEKHPDLIHWTQNYTEVHLSDIDKICEKVLPEYFRHSNFNSFIRQLNMYSFHKTKKIGRSITFKNQLFKKGNQINFFLIQRKRKFKQLENYPQRFERQCEDLISQVNRKTQITPLMKQTLISLFQYKYISYENLRRMKCEMDAIYKQLKDSRNKKVQDICADLKSQFSSAISQLNSQAKKIDQFIESNFIKESEETRESLQHIPNQRVMKRNNLQGSNHTSLKCIKSKSMIKEDISEKVPHIQIKSNYNSFNSFPIFLEEFKTKKQQFSFQQKLYNPFNSQTSFLFLPNYIGGPSQMPLDGRYGSVFHYKQDQILNEKDGTFDDYEQSASISFVKDLQNPEIQNFGQNT